MPDDHEAEKTEARLLQVALRQFGENGFQGVSIRSLSKAASSSVSAIDYHYGGKLGLYLATAEYAGSIIGERLSAALTGAVPATDLTVDAACRELETILVTYLRYFLSPDSDAMSLFVMREQMQPTEAFDILYERTFRPIADRIIALITRISNGAISDEQARMRFLLMFGQGLMFRVSRQSALRIMGWNAITEDYAASIEQTLQAHCKAILDALRAEGEMHAI
ncbi:transcriptional regulator, TetR family [Cohaesibacter marisflavi]|uniref:Transcriptional regulator, TetR family n=1 Tax=Cohaesibacter marisflavi TaxID=655353 RepID=A0A1I5F0T6_9HYPH|nr:CerR family C-terminal domain-containing protein [Cohaesibacter marisflavi]SFO17239.1 transcriptional regulator, TetR family [Cohaesibacter marisflavi]